MKEGNLQPFEQFSNSNPQLHENRKAFDNLKEKINLRTQVFEQDCAPN